MKEPVNSNTDERFRYAANLEQAGKSKDALVAYGAILTAKPHDQSYSLAVQAILRIGLPWVEFDPPDAPNTVQFYNVMHWGTEGKRVPHVFTWDAKPYEHPEHIKSSDGKTHRFTYDLLSSILTKEKIQKRPPTVSAVHSHVLTLEELARLGLQPDETGRARRFIREHVKTTPLTWSIVDYDTPCFIQDYDKPEERDNVDIGRETDDGSYRDTYLIQLNWLKSKQGDIIKNVVLRAEESLEEIDRMYNDLLELNRMFKDLGEVIGGVVVHRLPQEARVKGAVLLHGTDTGFHILLTANPSGHAARLVASYIAKS